MSRTPSSSNLSASAMLSGIRILDLTSVVFGPYATRMLSDLGAEVIKVEPPEGDVFRRSGKPARSKRMSPGHLTLNRGKKCISLDLKTEAGRQDMTDLLRSSDIFIHNVREDAITRLGFDLDNVRAINPDIIYVHCVGFGSGGSYSGLQAYDDVIQAASGAATLAGRVDGSGQARYLPSLIADKVAGLHGVQAVLAAYIHKLRTGEAQFVEVPMFESFVDFMLVEHLAGLTFDPPNAPACYHRQIDPDRQPFPTADGFVSIVAYTPPAWSVIFDVLGDPDFLDDPSRDTLLKQFHNQDQLYKRAAELTPRRSSAEWVDLFRAARIPCMAVRDMGDILGDPHLKEADFFRRYVHPSEGPVVEPRPPIRYERYTPPPAKPADLIDGSGTDIREGLLQSRKKRGV